MIKHLEDIFEGQPNKTGVKKTKEGKMYLEIPVPGFTKDDLDIQYLEDGRVIEVVGKRKGFDGEECRFTHHNVIRKPIEIEKAVCENGLLRIEFKDGMKKRQIAIE